MIVATTASNTLWSVRGLSEYVPFLSSNAIIYRIRVYDPISDSDSEQKEAIHSDSSTCPNSNARIKQSQAVPISDLDPDDIKANDSATDSDTLTHLDHITEKTHSKDQEQVSAQILPQDPAVSIKGEVSCVPPIHTANRQQYEFVGALESTPHIELTETFPWYPNNDFLWASMFPTVPAYSPLSLRPLPWHLSDPQSILPVSDHSQLGVGDMDHYNTGIAAYRSMSTSPFFSSSSKLQEEDPGVDLSRQSYFSSVYDVNYTECFPLRNSTSKRSYKDDVPIPPKRHKTESQRLSLSEIMIEAAYDYTHNRLCHLNHGAKASYKDQPAKVLQRGIFDVTRDLNLEKESKLDERCRLEESKKLLDEYKREVSKIGPWEETNGRYVELRKIREVFELDQTDRTGQDV